MQQDINATRPETASAALYSSRLAGSVQRIAGPKLAITTRLGWNWNPNTSCAGMTVAESRRFALAFLLSFFSRRPLKQAPTKLP